MEMSSLRHEVETWLRDPCGGRLMKRAREPPRAKGHEWAGSTMVLFYRVEMGRRRRGINNERRGVATVEERK